LLVSGIGDGNRDGFRHQPHSPGSASAALGPRRSALQFLVEAPR
jgi:hypothetical protein